MRSPSKTLRRFVSFSLTACGLFLVVLGVSSCASTPIASPAVSVPITLHASNATVHATMMRYEPQTNKNCLGYWTKAEDWADWTFDLPRAGSFEVEVWQGCGKGQGGSDVAVEVGGKRFDFVVEDTGHFQNFTPRRVGRVELPAGKHTLAIKPQRKQAAAVMDIRRVMLLPVNPLPALTPAARALSGGKRVVFVGDSITYAGEWLEFVEAYLRVQDPKATFEFINIGLPSETVSGLSEPGHAGGSFPRPDLHERLDRALAKLKPDVLVACYGMNDGIYYPIGEERFAAFKNGMLKLREKAAAAGAKVIHVTPPTFDAVPIKANTLPAGRDEYRQPYVGYNDVLDRYSEWLVSQRAQGWQVVDIHSPMNAYLNSRRADDSRFRLAGDGVHANTQGHWLMAREFLRSLDVPDAALVADSFELATLGAPTAPEVLELVKREQRVLKDAWLNEVGHKRPGMAKGKPVADAEREATELADQLKSVKPPRYPGKRSKWNGFDRYDFEVGGKPVLVVAPKSDAPGRPWVWHGEFFGHKPAPDIALLERGFHVVYMTVPDMLGSPTAVAHWNAFYRELTEKYGFAKKAALVGLSRGGLYCYNLAAANPDKVACLYGDAPVCDFRSWPGAFGKGKRSDRDWQLVLQQYDFKNDDEAKAYAKNPVDNLAPLAAAKVPLLHVYGDADEVVPWDENTGVIAERYKKLGGDITLIAKPGVKHHPHGLEDSTPIVEFIWKHTASAKAKRRWQK
jgi:pimeloyl-ACP methyl ester carboxylesterase/lysophospholipase L1-like esterase